jgi:HEPN domain-containing protein
MIMPNRANDWFNQAMKDIEMALVSREAGRHEWACFAAQQAAEKAVKALHLHLGQEAWGHVIAKLLKELPGSISYPMELIDKAHVLDNFYIPSRYPNSHPTGSPFDHFGQLQSEEAIKFASEIIEFVRIQMA